MSAKEPCGYNAWTDWRNDLRSNREFEPYECEAIAFVLRWYFQWAESACCEPGRKSARRFWVEAVTSKSREDWQLDHWAQAIRWYLQWLEQIKNEQPLTRDDLSIRERVVASVHRVGARRGLALRTRKTYAGWAGRYAL